MVQARSISSAVAENSNKQIVRYKKKEVNFMVELDQFKFTLNSYQIPLKELRDSL